MVKYEVISGQLEQLWANHPKGSSRAKMSRRPGHDN